MNPPPPLAVAVCSASHASTFTPCKHTILEQTSEKTYHVNFRGKSTRHVASYRILGAGTASTDIVHENKKTNKYVHFSIRNTRCCLVQDKYLSYG